MHRAASVVVAVGAATFVAGCAAGPVTYESHARGNSMALVVQHSGLASLTGRVKAHAVVTNVSARLGLKMLVVFCAPDVKTESDRHRVAVTSAAPPGEEGYDWTFSIDLDASLPQAHDFVCGFRIRKPKDSSPASYIRGALLALTLSRR
jgi:hypothetical protein